MNDDLNIALLNLVHEYGYMAVESALTSSVLEQASNTDPYVVMVRLLKDFTLDDVASGYFGRAKVNWSHIHTSTDDCDISKIVKINDFYYKIDGYVSSYSDTSFKIWKVVTPKQQTITVYE